MELTIRKVRVEDLEAGGARFGLLAEGDDGRAVLALGAADAEELTLQLDECGGPAAYLRRFGKAPLDPEGVGAVGGGAGWVPEG